MPSNKLQRFLTERTTLRTWLTAFLVTGLGIILLVLAETNSLWVGYASIQSVVRDIGSLMIASVAVSLLWELWGKRAFLDELLLKIQLSEEIRSAGLIRFNPSFHRDIDWDQLFQTANEIDIFFVHGRTWRRMHGEQLVAAAKRHARIRVVLPDPQDEIAITEIARRTQHAKETIRERIIGAQEDFQRLHALGAKIDIWLLPALPLFSFYRFNNTIILSFYSHRLEQKPAIIHIPTFILEKGDLYKFVQDEFEAMIDNKRGLAKRVQDNEPAARPQMSQQN